MDATVKQKGVGIFGSIWQRRAWWLLPLAVLVLLLGAIYALVHLSAADPETYRTTSQNFICETHLC
ncbi:MAG TPA: DUF5989 family protein [Candidatus Sulfotelmatobacter sp.]|nr:DUF5989 family protein [Candidatus Sulfotelmatobacter sp.]